MKYGFYFLLILCLSFGANGQDKTYAFEVIEKLTSKDFFGRGYINDGHIKAANYIASEYEKIGLKSFDDNYLQHFSFSLNQVVGHPSLKLGAKELELGKDYIIDPSSPPVQGSFEVVYLDEKSLPTKQKKLNKCAKSWSGKAVVIDTRKMDKLQAGVAQQIKYQNYPAAILVFVDDNKLTAHMSQQKGTTPIVQLKVDEGFEVPSNVEVSIESLFYPSIRSQNVVGFLPGEEKADSFIYITAHYDHLGGMGEEVFFPGANDNASGIAFLLNMARELSLKPRKYSYVFIAFGAEEVGLVGSQHYVSSPLSPLAQIKIVLNFDILGTGDEGIKVVNATNNLGVFNQLVSLNEANQYLKKVGKRGPAANSDHHSFYQKGVPAVFIYTLGGIDAYHDVLDQAATLPLTKYNDLFALIQGFLQEL